MNTRIILKFVVVAGLLALASTSYAAGGSWTRDADMPTARWGPSTSVVDGKIYSIGGGQDPYSTYLSTVELYDPETDTWTRKADMPTGRAFAGASVVNGKIYVVGGSTGPDTGISSMEEYDPTTDTWTRKTNMPTARNVLSTSEVNGKIYAIGGAYTTNPAAVEEYDPATDTWTRKANMPTARNGLSTSVIDGRIYVIGGATSFGGSGISTVEEYDPATDTWRQKANMRTARVYLSTSVVNGKIYAIGGTAGNWNPVLSTVEEYDPVTDTWAKKPDLPTARMFVPTSMVNGEIYAIGGSLAYWPWTPTSTVEVYDPNPLVFDFNGDGIVDSADMCMMVDYWHTDEQTYDIAPPPSGDGIVDVQDLILLSEHLFEEILPSELVAYWKLDETEGIVAYNSTGESDGFLFGDPVWRPAEGKRSGAMELDGIDDYVVSVFVLNPADGPFSVFAWIKGGAPGQVIISQMDGSGSGETWLGMDAVNGYLMTGLLPPPLGRFLPQPLESQNIVTDDKWHHIGLAWDGAYRYLYVDGTEVARDTGALTQLLHADGGLYVGTNNNLDAGTFFSGLIDDVRIYNVALSEEQIGAIVK